MLRASRSAFGFLSLGLKPVGFIAREVEAAAKEIGYNFSGVDKPKNDKDIYGLRYAEFVVPLVKGMQEQQEMIEDLEAENGDLKNLVRTQSSKYWRWKMN